MFLDDAEIAQLTQRTRRPAQSRVLSFMGIEHKRRPDGSIAVLRAHVERMFGGAIVPSERPRKVVELDVAAIKAISERRPLKKVKM